MSKTDKGDCESSSHWGDECSNDAVAEIEFPDGSTMMVCEKHNIETDSTEQEDNR